MVHHMLGHKQHHKVWTAPKAGRLEYDAVIIAVCMQLLNQSTLPTRAFLTSKCSFFMCSGKFPVTSHHATTQLGNWVLPRQLRVKCFRKAFQAGGDTAALLISWPSIFPAQRVCSSERPRYPHNKLLPFKLDRLHQHSRPAVNLSGLFENVVLLRRPLQERKRHVARSHTGEKFKQDLSANFTKWGS